MSIKLFRAFAGLTILLGLSPLAVGTGQADQPLAGQVSGGGPALVSADFDMFAPKQGWLLTAGQLFITNDSGSTWREISPALTQSGSLSAVSFLNKDVGWAVASGGTLSSIQLLRTTDGGLTWVQTGTNFDVKAGADGETPFSQAAMSWVDADTGWLLLKQATGVNFSQGWLLWTADGGVSWTLLEAPAAEKMVFLTSNLGYMKNPFRKDALFETADGGKSWKMLEAASFGLAPTAQLMLPVRGQAGTVLIEAIVQEDQGSKHVRWISAAAGENWTTVASDSVGEDLAASVVFPYKQSEGILEAWPLPQGDRLESLAAGSGAALSPIGMVLNKFSSPDDASAWAGYVFNLCSESASPIPKAEGCQQSALILQTEDGGATWSPLPLPTVTARLALPVGLPEAEKAGLTTSDNPKASGTETIPYWVRQVTGNGFDACEIPTLSELDAWFSYSPYEYVNMYIGGAARACANTALTASYVNQMYIRGWRFIPTWVGPQAPCTSFRRKFSYDPAEAYAQGVDNANQAKAVLQSLGLTNADGSGSLVYYDLEYFSGDTACKTAVRSFLDGWTTRLHELNNYSGLYGSSCNIYNNQLYTIDPPPDFVWLASWRTTYYDPTQTVWSVSCLPETYWSTHQRLHQYTGDHDETWGGVTFEIDCDVLDGAIVGPLNADFTDPVTTASISGTVGISPWYKSPVTVTLSASDSGVGVKYSFYKIDQGSWQVYSTPFQVTGSGQKTISYLSMDKVNNREAVKTLSFYVDTQPPKNPAVQSPGCLAFNGLPLNQCADPDFTWEGASDSGVGLAASNTYEVYWGTNASATAGTLMSATRFDPPAVSPRVPMYLRIRAQDKHGNWSAWATIFTFIYDPNRTNLLILPVIFR